MPLRLIVLFHFLLVLCLVRAQSFTFRHYQVEQGLSNNTVFCTAQDQRGFMWMGTKDGLNRFDGYTFRVFRNDPDDSLSLGDSFVRSLLISKNNTVYAGTRNGLYRFDEINENFAKLFTTTDEIKEIAEDQSEQLWFIAGQKLFCLKPGPGKMETVEFNQYSFTSVAADKHNVIWAATANGLLLKFDRNTNGFTHYTVLKESKATLPAWIEKIQPMANGNMLIGTANYGALVFDAMNGTAKEIISKLPGNPGIFVRDFLPVNDSAYWIASENGIFIYETPTGKITHLEKQINNAYALSDNAVYTLSKDKEGGIWAGTYFGGINYYPRQYATFNKLLPGFGKEALSGQAVREITADNLGNLWIGTEDGGLNRLEKESGKLFHFKSTGKPGDIAYSNIHGLMVQGQELWVGTFEHGLDVMDIPSGRVIAHYPKQGDTSLRSTFFVVVYALRSGTILAGTRLGMYQFNKKGETFERVKTIPPQCFVHSILEDSKGNIWVGTLGNGLYCIKKDNTLKHFTHNPKERNGISGNAITTIFQSSDSTIWVGTEGGGLCRFNAEVESFERFTLKEGFPSNTIFKILEDTQRQLWITTSRGLVAMQPSTDSIKVYTTDNGLLSNQFNYNSGYRDSTGTMYFGSAKGLISFNPQLFSESAFIPPVHITGLAFDGKEIHAGNNPGILKKSLLHTKVITLGYNQSSFSIDFAALSFTAPQMTEYQYIMEGLDNDWTYLKTNRKVYFTNLAPGTYRFKVKAANSSGQWSSKLASLTVVINPPIWASPLAYIAYTVIALLIGYLLFKNYHHAMTKRAERKLELMEHEKEKEMYQAKIEFFTNVAHEIKTPLTLIKAPMEQILKKGLANGALSFELSMMERNTNRLLELANQLLDFRKIETSGYQLSLSKMEIQDFLNDRYQSFKPLAEQRKVSLTIQLPDEPIFILADADAMQKITDNLVYNALSYCHHKVKIILFPVDLQHPAVTIHFCNDGPGIPQEMTEQIFQPFFRIQHAKNKSGSGIGLALAKSLAEMHNGTLSVASSTQQMTIFELILPCLPVNNN